MSRLAYPYDNAMAESFMKTLKTEEVEGRPYRDIAHARDNIEAFIEQVYNKTRLHSALRYQSPDSKSKACTSSRRHQRHCTWQPTVPNSRCQSPAWFVCLL